MAEKRYDGGPAFPQQMIDGRNLPELLPVPTVCGMSLRDWFAGQALAGLLSRVPLYPSPARAEQPVTDYADVHGIVRLAMQSADLMLAERAR